MKNSINLISILVLGVMFVFTACNKDASKKDNSLDYAISGQKADIIIDGKGDFMKVITKPLIKPDDCYYIVEGTIEYRLDGEVAAVVDYGNGECDNIATKTVNGETYVFELNEKDKGGEYEKIIIEPLVKPEDCKCIVSGIIQFLKGDIIVATIDYGNGECDNWATKTWDGGSVVFSLDK